MEKTRNRPENYVSNRQAREPSFHGNVTVGPTAVVSEIGSNGKPICLLSQRCADD